MCGLMKHHHTQITVTLLYERKKKGSSDIPDILRPEPRIFVDLAQVILKVTLVVLCQCLFLKK